MRNRTATPPPMTVGEAALPPTMLVAARLIDQLSDQQRRDALMYLVGATPHRVIDAFAAVTGG